MPPNIMGKLQCPVCGALWSPTKNALTERINALKIKHSQLLKKREDLVNEHYDDNSYEFRFKHSKLKAEIAESEHCIRCLNAELKGKPVQLWQNRYAKALQVAETMLNPQQFAKYKEEIDRLCRPEGLR